MSGDNRESGRRKSCRPGMRAEECHARPGWLAHNRRRRPAFVLAAGPGGDAAAAAARSPLLPPLPTAFNSVLLTEFPLDFIKLRCKYSSVKKGNRIQTGRSLRVASQSFRTFQSFGPPDGQRSVPCTRGCWYLPQNALPTKAQGPRAAREAFGSGPLDLKK